MQAFSHPMLKLARINGLLTPGIDDAGLVRCLLLAVALLATLRFLLPQLHTPAGLGIRLPACAKLGILTIVSFPLGHRQHRVQTASQIA